MFLIAVFVGVVTDNIGILVKYVAHCDEKKLGLELFSSIRTISMFLDPNHRKYSKF